MTHGIVGKGRTAAVAGLALAGLLAGCGGGGSGPKASAGPGRSNESTTSRPASGSGSTTPSGASSDLAHAHGIFIARCTSDQDSAGNDEHVDLVDVRDPRDGHVVASRAFRTPFGRSANPVVFGDPLSLALCGQSPQRNALDAGYGHVVASAHLADNSEHAGILDLGSGKFTDLRAGAVKGALAPVLHDGPAQFGPDGQIWFGESEGSSGTDFRLISVDPSTLTATVRLDNVQQDLVNTTSVPTLTAKAALIVAKPPVGYPPAAFCNCAPVPNPTGGVAAQVDAAGISVFLPPEWHRKIIELPADGRDFGGQKWSAGTDLAWLDDQRFVCTCVGSSGGVGLALVTTSANLSGITVVPILPDTDRVSHDVVVAPSASGIAFISTGHGEDALFTVSPKGDAARLVALPADSHLLEWR